MKKSMLVMFMVIGMVAAMVSVSRAVERFQISGWLKSVDEANSVVVIVVNPQIARRHKLPKQITVSLDKRYIKHARRLDDESKRVDPGSRAEVFVSIELVEGKYIGKSFGKMSYCDG